MPAELAEAIVIMRLEISISLAEYGEMSARLRDDLLILNEAESEVTKRQMDSAKRGRR